MAIFGSPVMAFTANDFGGLACLQFYRRMQLLTIWNAELNSKRASAGPCWQAEEGGNGAGVHEALDRWAETVWN